MCTVDLWLICVFNRVADIDDYLSQPTTQAYLGTLSRLPRPELVVAIGGLKARCVQLAK